MSSKPSPNVLTGERAAAVSSWQLPVVEGPQAMQRRNQAAEQQNGNAAKKAWDDGFAKGYADGIQAGEAEYQQRIAELGQRVAELDGTLQLLARPLGQLDAEIERELVNLALAVAKHLVRRELKADPGQVIAVIRETVGLLPAAARDVRVHLHPEDAALVREKLAKPHAERAWTIVEDPVLSRGGCRVTTDTALIDARLETRLATVITTLLGDDRSAAPREVRT